MDALTTVYTPTIPVSLSATLRPLQRGQFDPTFRADASGVWRTLLTPLGGATLHLARSSLGVAATAWGPGASWALEGVPELLGAGDDWSGLDVSANPFLADSLRRNPGLRLLRTRQVFEMLFVAVLEQKVTGKEARHSWRVLVTRYGTPAPGPAPEGMRVFAPASVWRAVPSWEWHRAGVGPERSATIMRAAVVAASLERTLQSGGTSGAVSIGTAVRGGPAVERALRSISGVGVWTAAETMQRAHGDADSPSIGDYHLPSVVGWALTGSPVDDDGMLELLAPWASQRQRIVRLIEASGFTPPRHGPRATVQDHRAH